MRRLHEEQGCLLSRSARRYVGFVPQQRRKDVRLSIDPAVCFITTRGSPVFTQWAFKASEVCISFDRK